MKTLLLLAALFSPAAHADTDDFCANPVEAICGSSHTKKEVKGVQANQLELDVVLANFDEVKRYLKAAIEEQAILGNITTETRDAMTAKIDKVVAYTPEMLQKKSGDNKWLLPFRMFGYYLTCGFNGLESNAYSSTDGSGPDAKPYILLCPGWLARAVGDGADPIHNFRNIIQVMSHELGHHLDYDNYPEIYKSYGRCLRKNYADDLKFGKEFYDKVIESFPPQLDLIKDIYKVNRHSREITADFWGAQTTRQYLATVDAKDRLAVLREAWNQLCGSEDEGIHPTGAYRINTLLHNDPGIRELMGCKATEKPGCTLSGASP